MHTESNFKVKNSFLHATLAVSMAWLATSACAADWIGAGLSTDGDAKVELSKTFTKKAGTFKAEPESVMDKKKSIKGNFVVGTYRYVYKTPSQEDGQQVDEMVSTELMDCENKYYGTLKQTKKFHGKVVMEKNKADADVLMTQITMPTVDAQLCGLYAGALPTADGRKPVANPDYRPEAITDTQVDALIDKYAPPKKKK